MIPRSKIVTKLYDRVTTWRQLSKLTFCDNFFIMNK